MATTRLVPRSYEEAVAVLKRAHAEEADSDLAIYLFPDEPAREVVRFVEVSASNPAEPPDSDTAWAVTFRGSADFPWMSSVILLTPEDWDRVRHGGLHLPDGWHQAKCQRVWPE
jgi:hypothetical protein